MRELLDNSEPATFTAPRLLPVDVASRRLAVAAGGPWAALADELASELSVLLRHELPIPAHKARMTRIGGRCPVHGSYLEFDPWSPHSHQCVACGQAYVGKEHDEWWSMGAQLWTVERAVHAATLYLLRGDEVHAALAAKILSELADRYLEWPNRDNVLGPSRPFFSTYLESIWLLNICHALDLLEAANAPQVDKLGRSLRERVIRPSSELIAGFHEGTSNRQVWNEVALLSALHSLQDDASMMLRLDSKGGLPWLMTHGLLEDGTWFEGENYHVFAHRGLWYGVNLLRARVASGDDEFVLPENLERRFSSGYLTPFLGLLPDDTLPSRRDSPYAVSVRQWRFAEWCELGYADNGSADLASMLSHLYSARADFRSSSRDKPAGPVSSQRSGAPTSERSRSLADVERNTPAQALSRSSLSWRALLCAPIEPVPDQEWAPESVCLPSQGLAVLRRNEGNCYVALEGGHTGGGHGHPDALSLTLQTGADRWLDDPGTGSYVDKSLHWYRSTLAHNAPLINGASQQPVASTLEAFEDRGAVGWIVKSATGLASGVSTTRAIVACDGYLVDVFDWSATDECELTLPIGGNLSLDNSSVVLRTAPSPDFLAASGGAGGLEDGFDFVHNVENSAVPRGQSVHFEAQPTSAAAYNSARSGSSARLWYVVHSTAGEHESDGSDAAVLTRGVAPGAPTHAEQERYWLSARGRKGRMVGVWAWSSGEARATDVCEVIFGGVTDATGDAGSIGETGATGATDTVVEVTTADGTRALHSYSDEGWAIDLLVGASRSHIDLIMGENLPEASVELEAPDEATSNEDGEMLLEADFVVPWVDFEGRDVLPGEQIEGALLIPLGSSNYLGTEQSWQDAGEPVAMLQLVRTDTHLVADMEVTTGPIESPMQDEQGDYYNPLDNESADINADGLQWYIGKPDSKRWSDAALCLPARNNESDSEAAYDADDVSTAQTRRIEGKGSSRFVARWRPTEDGWAMRLEWPIDDLPVDEDGCIAFDLIVNERPAERERRRGQLVLSGGGGFSYLRGDRSSPDHALVIAVT